MTDWQELIDKYGVEKVWDAIHALVSMRAIGWRLARPDMGKLESLRMAMLEILDGHCTHPGIVDLSEPGPPVSCNICRSTFINDKWDPRVMDFGLEPPLLREMTELALTGHTRLPPDPDWYHGSDVEMRELEWGPNYRCFIGGPEFFVRPVDPSFHNHVVVPREPPMMYYHLEVSPGPVPIEVDVYEQVKWGLAVHPYGARWQASFMVHSSYKEPSREERTARIR